MYISARKDFGTEHLPELPAITSELTELIEAVPFATWQDYSNKHPDRTGSILGLNALFAAQMLASDWWVEPTLANGNIPDGLKTIAGLRVVLEVQFGNHARDSVDGLKFIKLIDQKLADVCVRVAFDSKTGKLCASGIASHEHFCRELTGLGWRYDRVPTISLAISETGAPRVDFTACGVAPKDQSRVSKNPAITAFATSALAELGNRPLAAMTPQQSLF